MIGGTKAVPFAKWKNGRLINNFLPKPKVALTKELVYMKNQHCAQCTEEAEREVGGGCTNIMMTEKL
jgi:hypothetical protein